MAFVVYRDSILGPLLGSVSELWAQSTGMLLRGIGLDVTRSGTILTDTQGFGIEIYYRCTAVLPVSGLIAGILATHASVRSRLTGIVVGAPLILLVNQLRLIHVYWMGTSDSALFDLAHEMMWPAVETIFVLSVWYVWHRWANTRSVHDDATSRLCVN